MLLTSKVSQYFKSVIKSSIPITPYRKLYTIKNNQKTITYNFFILYFAINEFRIFGLWHLDFIKVNFCSISLDKINSSSMREPGENCVMIFIVVQIFFVKRLCVINCHYKIKLRLKLLLIFLKTFKIKTHLRFTIISDIYQYGFLRMQI